MQYSVAVAGTVPVYATVQVEAETPAAAEQEALRQVVAGKALLTRGDKEPYRGPAEQLEVMMTTPVSLLRDSG